MDNRYIVVEGAIGVGKTSLSNILGERFGSRRIFERFEDNPFLANFYEDRQKYAFQTQLFFLLSRFRQQEELVQQDLFSSGTVSDYLFAKDRIFACLTLDSHELALYDRVFEALSPRVNRPDLVIFLKARLDVLLYRIKKRGREFERQFDAGYLEELVHAYNEFFSHYTETPLLVVDTSDIDFVHDEGDLRGLLGAIERARQGTHHYLPAQSKRAG
ncbi:deoxynucleoside kinase [Archangium sp.]|uniref:deoxynucleoside kinase n=1 Tax=Archangium sp. TaxID=1872627 RepID=UPI00286B5EF9|nr:deoxynucleoside kinase [Archangium sp.]